MNLISQIAKSKRCGLASLTIDGNLTHHSLPPVMTYYLDRKSLVWSINIKNSTFEIGNSAHEKLVNQFFNQAKFIDTIIKFK